MPKDVSPSSSEDEAENIATNSTEKQKESEKKKKTTRYQCPADFVTFCHEPCSSTLTHSLHNNNKELWLIKAPASFNPECFRGFKVPLSGLQTLKVPAAADGVNTGSSQQVYSVLASHHGTAELRLLTSGERSSDGVVFGPTFSGLLNVCESYGDSSTNQVPQVVPAAPAPSIPPGLKQRFHPFGSKTPTPARIAGSEVDGAALGPSSATPRPLGVKRLIEDEAGEEEGEDRRKKKKKKKEKRMKVEPVVEVKQELEVQEEAMILQEDEHLEKRKKKKKKKDKDREREEVKEEGGLDIGVRVKAEMKSEPIDTEYDDVTEKKKKKKKKKSKTEED